MKYKGQLMWVIGALVIIGFCGSGTGSTSLWKGITVTAPQRPFEGDPMKEIQEVGANAVAVIPYAYIMPGHHQVRFNEGNWQWWGERPEGIRATIQLAKKRKLSVLMKPQIYIPQNWIGSYLPETEAQWEEFTHSYETYMLTFAQMAEEMNVELFCIGTELKAILSHRPHVLDSLIELVRSCYSGKLVYAANWDNYQEVPLWDNMDYIGINAYFPLTEEGELISREVLAQRWQRWKREMATFQQKVSKPVVFTEYGYLSIDGCTQKTWELEQQIYQRPVNEICQAKAVRALWDSFSAEEWWHGGFLWKWFPEGMGHEGYPDKDYTPQKKEAESQLRAIFH